MWIVTASDPHRVYTYGPFRTENEARDWITAHREAFFGRHLYASQLISPIDPA